MYHHHGVARKSPHMVAEPGGPRKRIDEQIVELSIEAGEGLLVELKVKGSITELISRLLGETSSETRQKACFDEETSKTVGDKNPGCESSSGQGMEEARNDSSLAVGKKFGAKRRLSWKHKETERRSDGHLSSQKCGVRNTLQKYKGRVVLRGDIVKDDSGAFAVFTEQGSSSFQMTAAKVMDVIASS